MTNVKVVIGANLGDEGKGLMTDFFARQSDNSLVVRFNGGAQAGHTVQLPSGERHVFSHFGSGTLAGVPTYLSRFFLANPIIFVKEMKALQEEGFFHSSAVYIDPECYVTTPYDMLINQIAETSRGHERHGSCGLGISETVVRSENPAYRLRVKDLLDPLTTSLKLMAIQEGYVPQRLEALGISQDAIPKHFVEHLKDQNILASYLSDCETFMDQVKLRDVNFITKFDNVIFEGAQGLLLDENMVKYSPYITHSSTGMPNVVSLLREAFYDLPENPDVEIVYVTRAYLTRHGAGPLPRGSSEPMYDTMVDLTNQPNSWQGTLRFAPLDWDLTFETIFKDFLKAETLDYRVSLAVTCLDQMPKGVPFYLKGKKEARLPSQLASCLVYEAGGFFTSYYESYGPTHETIKVHTLRGNNLKS